MDTSERKKILKEQYRHRHPDMGIIGWETADQKWVDISRDITADYNGTKFQLELGSWPNRVLQKIFSENPGNVRFTVYKKLDYEDPSEDYSDDLQLLMMEFLEAFPDAKPLRPGRKFQ